MNQDGSGYGVYARRYNVTTAGDIQTVVIEINGADDQPDITVEASDSADQTLAKTDGPLFGQRYVGQLYSTAT